MNALLSVRGLTRRFGGLVAVDGIDLDVHQGEILGVVGPNGSGKTTLFSIISGFLAADRGTVRFQGEDIGRLSAAQRARTGLVRTFQIVQPFAETSILDNVTIAALKGGRVPLAEAKATAHDVLNRLGFGSIADRRVEALTIADRKRLELARAIACKPKLLLLDEVMAGLRPSEVDEAIARIRAIRELGVTIVLVEHLMRAVVALSDRLLVLQQGRVIAEGAEVRQILESPVVIDAYFGRHG